MNAVARQVEFHPTIVGTGKWHIAEPVTDVALCGAPVVVDTSASPVVHSTADVRFHPVCCRRRVARSLIN